MPEESFMNDTSRLKRMKCQSCNRNVFKRVSGGPGSAAMTYAAGRQLVQSSLSDEWQWPVAWLANRVTTPVSRVPVHARPATGHTGHTHSDGYRRVPRHARAPTRYVHRRRRVIWSNVTEHPLSLHDTRSYGAYAFNVTPWLKPYDKEDWRHASFRAAAALQMGWWAEIEVNTLTTSLLTSDLSNMKSTGYWISRSFS